MHADILQVRAPALNFYVLRDPSGLYLLDAGFIGGRSLLRRALRDRGWDTDPIRGIIVTHGHLDHILNVAPVARETDAWIAAPRLDADHYCGRPVYRGWARVTDGLEKLGRPLLGFQPFTPDRWLDDGDRLDVFQGGLCAVHLPGHTHGQMGFYCERLRLLFSADLVACYGRARFPPAIFNSVPELIPQSAEKALALDLDGILPNHCDRASPQEHLRRFRDLVSRTSAKAG